MSAGNELAAESLDRLAWNYYEHIDSPAAYGARVRRSRALDLLGRGGGRLLDVGCGPGVLVEEAVKRGFEFWGVDGSPLIVEECRRRFGHLDRARFHRGDALRLDYPAGFFDAVLCLGVIDHIADYERVVREMSRVLRPGGALIVSFPNLLSPYATWRYYVFYRGLAVVKNRLRQWARRGAPLFPRRTICTARKARGLVARCCGPVEDVVYLNFTSLLSPLDELLPRPAAWLAERMEPLHSGPLRWLGAQFLLKARRAEGTGGRA